MKLLHTADHHIGKSFGQLDEDTTRAVQAAQIEVLEKMRELVRKEGIDLVVIAGDLFDSSSVSRTLRDHGFGILSIFAVPVYISPGTHDKLENSNVYQGIDASGNIKVFTKGSHKIENPILQVVLHSNPNIFGGGESLLDGLQPDHSWRYNIAILHGSLDIPGKHNPNDNIIPQQNLSKLGMDYIALGHWHTFQSYENLYCYSGTPETTKFDEGQDSGYVAIVDLSLPLSDNNRIKKVRVGKFKWVEHSENMSFHDSIDPIKELLDKYQSPDTLFRLRLAGYASPQLHSDLEKLRDFYESSFRFLCIDTSQLSVALKETGSFPTGTIAANFVTLCKQRIQSATDHNERRKLEDALKLGLRYFSEG